MIFSILIISLTFCTLSYSFLINSKLCRSTIQVRGKSISNSQSAFLTPNYQKSVVKSKNFVLKDILGLGPAEIAITLVVGLVLFGPETLKSLSKDVGRAAAELKEIPKTFKEGMEEGQESAQVSKMKAIAAEKRKKRDEKLASAVAEDDEAEE
mmetsp:Transcript_33598/g.45996  ORF Transcript_33598/g.45996 Transcript_33598/m.45996 type:complete len:153 (+) Transcript_33598:29-487(+)